MTELDKSLAALSLSPKILALDVECAATGPGHNDRAPCRIAVVNDELETIFDVVVKVEPECFSPMTAITGLTRDEIARGVSR